MVWPPPGHKSEYLAHLFVTRSPDAEVPENLGFAILVFTLLLEPCTVNRPSEAMNFPAWSISPALLGCLLDYPTQKYLQNTWTRLLSCLL